MKDRKEQGLSLVRAGAEAGGLTSSGGQTQPEKNNVEGEKREKIGSRGGSWHKCLHTNHSLDMDFYFSRMRKVWNVRIIWQTYIKLLTNGWLPKSLNFTFPRTVYEGSSWTTFLPKCDTAALSALADGTGVWWNTHPMLVLFNSPVKNEFEHILDA